MEVDLSDKTYDGYEQGDRFVDGLGQLVDGQKGKDNFRTDIHGFGKGELKSDICICAYIRVLAFVNYILRQRRDLLILNTRLSCLSTCLEYHAKMQIHMRV